MVRDWTLDKIGFQSNSLWLKPGSKAAFERLKNFIKIVDRYDEYRDIPSVEGTSGLSVHLRFGTISIRELIRQSLKKRNKGSQTWLSELIWRDFYFMILDQFPHVVNGAFKTEYDKIQWPGREEHFEAWCDGKTGYPIVDAAMRHFNKTGWMHNRLRMIVASFLVKDLLIDWRKGESYFARYLLDYDLSANNGGWQWCASTGCDAQPYFRIFNPVAQSKKFDPNGEFIRANVEELKDVSSKKIHEPMESDLFSAQSYLAPIVNHSTQRNLALKLFEK
jgi:deoxyribodipyrimidine photo-lyase